MTDRVFCIDFGSAYTKVAFRRDPKERSELVRDPSLSLDDGLAVCIPSAMIVDTAASPISVGWGMAAANDRLAGDGSCSGGTGRKSSTRSSRRPPGRPARRGSPHS